MTTPACCLRLTHPLPPLSRSLSHRLSVRVENGRHETSVASQTIEIVYQDDDVVVIDKPCSIPVRKCCHIMASVSFLRQTKSFRTNFPSKLVFFISLPKSHFGFIPSLSTVGLFEKLTVVVVCFLFFVFLFHRTLCLGRIAATWWNLSCTLLMSQSLAALCSWRRDDFLA